MKLTNDECNEIINNLYKTVFGYDRSMNPIDSIKYDETNRMYNIRGCKTNDILYSIDIKKMMILFNVTCSKYIRTTMYEILKYGNHDNDEKIEFSFTKGRLWISLDYSDENTNINFYINNNFDEIYKKIKVKYKYKAVFEHHQNTDKSTYIIKTDSKLHKNKYDVWNAHIFSNLILVLKALKIDINSCDGNKLFSWIPQISTLLYSMKNPKIHYVPCKDSRSLIVVCDDDKKIEIIENEIVKQK